MRKRLIASVTCLCLLLIMLLSSTLAWFTDQTEATKSTMTVGNVAITQLEQYRDADGVLQPWHVEGSNYPPSLNPVVPNLEGKLVEELLTIGTQSYTLYSQMHGVIDKVVSVQNVGADSAFVRTIFAFEMLKTESGWENPVGTQVKLNWNVNADQVKITFPGTVIYRLDEAGFAEAAFVIGVATYADPLVKDATSAPSLLQFYLDSSVNSEFLAAVGPEYDILILSQAVQTAGFKELGYTATQTLDMAFGTATAGNAVEWFGDKYSVSAPDKSWYDPNAISYELKTADQLTAFAQLVNSGVDTFAGKTVTLTENVDLGNQPWIPIGSAEKPFKGTFDGNGKTVSNVFVETEIKHAGLFGYVDKGVSISNLTIDNVIVKDKVIGDETTCYGAVIGYCPGAVTLSNVHVTGDVAVSGEWYVGGLIGRSKDAVITDCSVVANSNSVISSIRWAGAISGYDNGAAAISGCYVENVTVQAQSFAGGIAGLGGKFSVINNNTVKNVTIALVGTEAEYVQSYGAVMGGLCVYNWDNSYLTAYDNEAVNVTYTLDGAAAEAREMGMKYPEDNDYGLVREATLKIGNVYFTSLKAACKYAAKDNSQVVIELMSDTVVPSNFKPEVAKNQNILIKTNGYDLLWLKVNTTEGTLETDAEGNLVTTVITAENMSTYITVKSGGSCVIE